MLKSILTLAFCSTLFFNSISQKLQGEWSGSFSYYHSNSMFDNLNNYPMKLSITLNSDSTYSVVSQFKGLDNDETFTTITCSVFLRIISEDSIYLQEMRIIKPENGLKDELKKMYLKIIKRKKGLVLQGTFEGTHEGNPYKGEITLDQTK